MNKKIYILAGVLVFGVISIMAINMCFDKVFIDEAYAESASNQNIEPLEIQKSEDISNPSNQPVKTSQATIVETDEIVLNNTSQNISEEDINYQKSTVSVDENGNTTIVAEIGINGYPEIVVEAGKPVNINFKADAEDISTCNNEILIQDFGVSEIIEQGDNIVTITPTQAGEYRYSCWMGMLGGTITVVEPGSQQIGALPLNTDNTAWVCPMTGGSAGGSTGGSTGGGCCPIK